VLGDGRFNFAYFSFQFKGIVRPAGSATIELRSLEEIVYIMVTVQQNQDVKVEHSGQQISAFANRGVNLIS
jgi:hypothetical protein